VSEAACRSLAVGEPAETAVPVLWLLLRPSKLGPVTELPLEEVAAPLQVHVQLACAAAVCTWLAQAAP
jgi:hypothetical protein